MTGFSLGIDIGTSGIRTAVLDSDGEVISDARVAHEPQKADHIDATAWWRAVKSCVAAQATALTDVGHSITDIARIGIDGTSGTMVLTDQNLRPVTRALMYNSSNFDAEAKVIAEHAPAIHITQGANSALARAMRLQSEDDARKAVHLLHQADFIIAKLMGYGGQSDHNNALKLGFDPETERWPDWFAQTGLRTDLLPTPKPAGAILGSVSPQVAKELGLSRDTIVHAGTTDSIAAFLAAAPLETGASVTSLGTTLAVKILSLDRIDAPEIGLYAHRLGDNWLIGGASNTGGGVLASLFSGAELQRLSEKIDPEIASPLEYYPLLKPGERFPTNDPNLAPVMAPRPADDAAYLHGLLESIARIEARCYASIVDKGGSAPTQLFTAGGGAMNKTWTKIRARVLGVTPQTSRYSEASVGVAKLVHATAIDAAS